MIFFLIFRFFIFDLFEFDFIENCGKLFQFKLKAATYKVNVNFNNLPIKLRDFIFVSNESCLSQMLGSSTIIILLLLFYGLMKETTVSIYRPQYLLTLE